MQPDPVISSGQLFREMELDKRHCRSKSVLTNRSCLLRMEDKAKNKNWIHV